MDKTLIRELRDVVYAQSMDGTWNSDPYMHGMANGLICALAIAEGKEPKYLEAPDEWLCDKRMSGNGESNEKMVPIKNPMGRNS